MTTYSIGTITLWTRLPKNQIHTLRHLNQLPGVYKTWNKTSVFPYQKNGILRFEITPFYNHFTEKLMFAHLKIMIDPLSTAASDLSNPEYIQNVLENTFDRLYRILPDEIFDSLQISQINFKGNLQMETQIQAEEYVALLYKGNRICQKKSYYDVVNQKWTTYEDPSYSDCKSYTLKISPCDQRIISSSSPDSSHSKNGIYFELECRRPKIRKIFLQHGIDLTMSALDTIYQLSSVAPETAIKDILKYTVGTGSFYTSSELKRLINSASYPQDIKDEMIMIAQMISRFHSVHYLINKDLITMAEWISILKKFNEIGISPIPIPDQFQYKTAPGILEWNT